MRSDYDEMGLGREAVLAHLEQGKPLNGLMTSPGATAALVVDSIAAVALDAHGGLGPTLIRHAPPRPKLLNALTAGSLAGLFPGASRRSLLALSAGLLQVHDFWEESHSAAQEADDLGEKHFSAYWHGIAHRREPDAGNASYWFRRVGRHAIFADLREEAVAIFKAAGDDRSGGRLMGGGGWDPYEMIKLCTSARPGTPVEALARRLQRAEMHLLLVANADALQGD
ncbi:hypothetical protein OJF2_59000 [Aquisphaera giovannonii]|uniref:Uncharacterized protein n=1 Tax=Aquisphaera giovannonii TaxID=406548 RepID=A0A5B9WBQ4_9BACT|nr:hypothetical protein [Aquisphaera giovannonii]QEH37310.1 hypothetical protein OJF2_59000 [Aquisphaera giovannonii]